MSEAIRQKFEPLVGQEFTVSLEGDQEATLKLDSLTANENLNTDRQGHFAMLFVGPKEFCLPQAIYNLKSDAIGEESLFLVPVGVEDQGYLYEAAYNYLKK